MRTRRHRPLPSPAPPSPASASRPTRNGGVHPEDVWCRKPVHLTGLGILMDQPPSRSRRTTLPTGTRATARSVRAAAPGPRHGAGDARCDGRCIRPAPTALPASHDEQSIEHLTPDGAHPPLRRGVRPRRPHWRAQHFDRLAGEDRVERGGELRIPIADQEPDPAEVLSQTP